MRAELWYPVVIINWVQYLGPPGPFSFPDSRDPLEVLEAHKTVMNLFKAKRSTGCLRIYCALSRIRSDITNHTMFTQDP